MAMLWETMRDTLEKTGLFLIHGTMFPPSNGNRVRYATEPLSKNGIFPRAWETSSQDYRLVLPTGIGNL